ncbi:MAG: S49 family peptidase [Armatimonadota bacterium]
MKTIHSLLFELSSGAVLALQRELALQIPELLGKSYADIREQFSIEGAARNRGGNAVSWNQGSTAVINVTGPLMRNDAQGLCADMFDGTSVSSMRARLREALADQSVSSILLYVDSPGGSVDGIADLADEIRAAARQKPLHAFIDGLGASAAYWLASSAGRITVSQTAHVGAIGVYATYQDTSKAEEMKGIKTTRIISSRSPMKALDPDTEEGRASIQSRVDTIADIFIKAVAKGRGVSAKTVEDEFGQGDTVTGKDAVERGMADAVGTLDDAINSLQKAQKSFAVGKPAAESPDIPAGESATLEPAPPAGGAAESDHGYRERLLDLKQRGL